MELREVFEPIVNFLKNLQKKDKETASKEKAKERLQLVLMQDRASVSPDFFEMMKKEIIEVIKKYIEIDEEALEVQLTRGFEDGDETGPALFANIPIKNIKPVVKKVEEKEDEDLITEVVNNEDIVEKANVEVAETVENETEKIEQAEEKVVEVIETATSEVTSEIIDADKSSTQEQIIEKVETAENQEEVVEETKQQSENLENVKEKINEVKEGVSETFEKVKKGAKEGVKKIKTKAQKKKVKE